MSIWLLLRRSQRSFVGVNLPPENCHNYLREGFPLWTIRGFVFEKVIWLLTTWLNERILFFPPVKFHETVLRRYKKKIKINHKCFQYLKVKISLKNCFDLWWLQITSKIKLTLPKIQVDVLFSCQKLSICLVILLWHTHKQKTHYYRLSHSVVNVWVFIMKCILTYNCLWSF